MSTNFSPAGRTVPLPVLDEPREKCGIFGIWGDEAPVGSSYYGLYSLQHRGQESAGIACTDGRSIERHTGMGLVSQVFTPEILERLDTHAQARQISAGGAIGHNRYSTSGTSDDTHAQPFVGFFKGGQVAIGHNGNLVNAREIRDELEDGGHAFNTTSDTEVILQLIAKCAGNDACDDPIGEAAAQLRGAFSLVFLFNDRIEALRDPWGWRPLVIGKMPNGAHILASETIALDVIGAEFVREIEPGEIVTINDDGISSRRYADATISKAHCVFEHVYFASPASIIHGRTIQMVREQFGRQLAIEAPVEADMVLPMPDSGRSAATGYAAESGLPYREGIIPNRYVGRTFIKPTRAERTAAVRLKLNVIADVVRGQRIIVVDDSIVRGTTTRAKMDQLRSAGALEIHLRISCPPIRNPCYFGIDFADPEQLIAAKNNVEQIRAMLGVDSLHYLSLDGMLESVSGVSTNPGDYCTACFTGVYPIEVDPEMSKDVLAKNC